MTQNDVRGRILRWCDLLELLTDLEIIDQGPRGLVQMETLAGLPKGSMRLEAYLEPPQCLHIAAMFDTLHLYLHYCMDAEGNSRPNPIRQLAAMLVEAALLDLLTPEANEVLERARDRLEGREWPVGWLDERLGDRAFDIR